MINKYKIIGNYILGDDVSQLQKLEENMKTSSKQKQTPKPIIKQNIINKQIIPQMQSTNNNDEKYIISGTCLSAIPFVLNINFIDNGEELCYETFDVNIINNNWTCELDIIPVSLDYMFIQNIDEYINDGKDAIVPSITSIDVLCSTKYIKDISHVCEGLDKNICDKFYEKFARNN